MTLLLLVSGGSMVVSGSSLAAAVIILHRADATVSECHRVLREAEEQWADRMDLAILTGDTASQLSAMTSLGTIMHAAQRLEDRHGRR